ncbi:MAG: hypothetical protein RUDDFDWM_001365 [Candidatus Fervidibacterota bacterium]
MQCRYRLKSIGAMFITFVVQLLTLHEVSSQELVSGALKIGFDGRTGRINSVSLSRSVWRGDGGFDVFDVSSGKGGKLTGLVKRPRSGQVELQCASSELRLKLNALFTSKGKCIEVNGEVQGDGERGIVVSFTLPVDAVNWYWWDDMRRGRRISSGVYKNTVRMPMRGEHSPYPLCAVTNLKMGLAIGIDLSIPVMYRFSYDANSLKLRLEYDFGLSSSAKSACKFRFSVFPVSEPAWGMRGAIADYYNLFSSSFIKRNKVDGIWMPFTPIAKIEHPEDFGFAFHEGTAGADYDEKSGIYTFVYVEPWSIRFYLPLDAPRNLSVSELLSHEALKAADKRLLEAVERCAAQSPEGTFHTRSYTPDWAMGKLVYDFIANADPDIPGEWTKARLMDEVIEKAFSEHRSKGIELDGVYFDGFGEWVRPQINERKDHWSVSDFPLSFSWETKRPCQITSFGIYEYLKAVAEKLHSQGKLVMANGYVWAYIPFSAHWIDVGGNEIRWTKMRDDYPFFDYRRFLAYRRPYLPLNNEDFEKVFTAELAKEYFDWALFYGFFPSCFSPTASHVGNYWNTPKFHNRDRHLFRIYIPLLRMLSSAGWNPITQAHPSGHGMRWFDVFNSDVLVERFGDYATSQLFFTVHNRSEKTISETLQIDYKPLGIAPKSDAELCIVEMLSGQLLNWDVDEMHIKVPINLARRSTLMLWLGRRSDILVWALKSACEFISTSVERVPKSSEQEKLVTELGKTLELLSDAKKLALEGLAKLGKEGKYEKLLKLLSEAHGKLISLCEGYSGVPQSELPILKRAEVLTSCAIRLALGIRCLFNYQHSVSPGDVLIPSICFRHGMNSPLSMVQSELALSTSSHGIFARSFYTWRNVPPNTDCWGSYRLNIPEWLKEGDTLSLELCMRVQVAGVELQLRRSEELKVVKPYAMRSEIVSNSSGLLLLLSLTNNTSRGVKGRVSVKVDGRQLKVDEDSVTLPAFSTVDVIRKVDAKDVEPGYHRAEVSIAFDSGLHLSDVSSFIYVPPSDNLLSDGGFEQSRSLGSVWSVKQGAQTKVSLDAKNAYAGKSSLSVVSQSENGSVVVSQSIPLKEPKKAFVVSALSYTKVLYPSERSESCAIKLSMEMPSKGKLEFTLPVDVDTGRWQLTHGVVFALDPITAISFSISLDGRAGLILFDELFLAPIRVNGNNIAVGAKVNVDSSFPSYDPKVINDTQGSFSITDDWAKVAWASSETEQPHFVELEFPDEVELRKLVIWWALDKGVYYTSRRYSIQADSGEGWRDLIQHQSSKDEPFTVHIFEQPLRCKRLRIFQPVGGGNERRPNLMWISEIEAY